MKKIIVLLIALGYLSTAMANADKFNAKMTKLTKKTYKAFAPCRDKACSDKVYNTFVEERLLLAKKFLRLSPSAVKKLAFKLINKEAKCAHKGKACLKKYNTDINVALTAK